MSWPTTGNSTRLRDQPEFRKLVEAARALAEPPAPPRP